jgi:hypothetical protein
MDENAKQLFHQGLGDCRVCMLGWEGEDVKVILHVPSRHDQECALRFVWTTRLRIDLDFGAYGGAPLLYCAKAVQDENKLWRVELDFGGAPEGRIELTCSEIICKYTT